MEGKESSYVSSKESRTIAGDKKVHHEMQNNDASKGWPPPRNKLHRSASIR